MTAYEDKIRREHKIIDFIIKTSPSRKYGEKFFVDTEWDMHFFRGIGISESAARISLKEQIKSYEKNKKIKEGMKNKQNKRV